MVLKKLYEFSQKYIGWKYRLTCLSHRHEWSEKVSKKWCSLIFANYFWHVFLTFKLFLCLKNFFHNFFCSLIFAMFFIFCCFFTFLWKKMLIHVLNIFFEISKIVIFDKKRIELQKKCELECRKKRWWIMFLWIDKKNSLKSQNRVVTFWIGSYIFNSFVLYSVRTSLKYNIFSFFWQNAIKLNTI